MSIKPNYNRALLPASLKDPFLDGCHLSECSMKDDSSPIRPRGNWKAEALIIGEAAGQIEERDNCTFIGPAGKLLEESLSLIGLSLDRDFLSINACLCRPHPVPGSQKENRTPTAAEISICRTYAEKIINLHKPQLIIFVGGQSSKSILKNAPTISHIAGTFLDNNETYFPIESDLYAILHPAFILRNSDEKQNWMYQLVRLRDYMIGRGLIQHE